MTETESKSPNFAVKAMFSQSKNGLLEVVRIAIRKLMQAKMPAVLVDELFSPSTCAVNFLLKILEHALIRTIWALGRSIREELSTNDLSAIKIA